jgi:hypothetical protein
MTGEEAFELCSKAWFMQIVRKSAPSRELVQTPPATGCGRSRGDGFLRRFCRKEARLRGVRRGARRLCG